ncbi:VOC family protein [Streptomyces sp. NPDC051907]|uniref:VOC family protein n=1 Tax=Streptomyces sp. NPDC051907 TaxID=3155284 RepID=UPI00343E8CDA
MATDPKPAEPSGTTTHDVHGAPCWITLLASDLSRAQAFYGAVFGWTFRHARLGDQFSTALHGGAPIAGIGTLEPDWRAPVDWTPYFAVGDADEAAARIQERCATVAVGPLSLPVGRGALAADRDGAVFGIWEGELISDWATWRKAAPVWLRLRTRDAFDAAIFYGQVLDWACDLPGCCQVDYEKGEVVVRQEGHVVARLSSGAVETAPNPMVKPRWHVLFPVYDVRAAVEGATRNGGSVLGERQTPDGPEVTLRDPEGALFTVTSDRAPR